jgi:DNA polymerase IV
VGMERTFETDIRDRALLDQFITKASHECARRLRVGNWLCKQVAIKMRGADFSTITRQQRLRVPTDLGREIAVAAHQLFERETLPSGGVRLFGVRAEGLIARDEGFEVALDQDERPQAAERAMDKIRGKYGAGAISLASLLEENK